MEKQSQQDQRKAAERRADIERLRKLENEAVKDGLKLHGVRDRLKAAGHLTRAWTRAKQAGVRKPDFQNAVFGRLMRPHASRQEFRLTNWTLKRGEDPQLQDLTKDYATKKEPHKELEPYLVGVAVAAEFCDEEPDDWKLDMVRDLSIWSRPGKLREVDPPDDRPAETLAILLNALCSELARRNSLGDTFDAIWQRSCRWHMAEESLEATDSCWMPGSYSPISPRPGVYTYYEEMFPFPSIPLLRIPYLVETKEFVLKPMGSPLGEPIGEQRSTGVFVYNRDLRLAVVPDGHGGFAAALETRPYPEIRFPPNSRFAGAHEVIHGHDPDSFASHIQLSGGECWGVSLMVHEEDCVQRDPEGAGWWFDHDVVNMPGEAPMEPYYLSYTHATAPYLRHWFTRSWRLGDVDEYCPWDRGNFDWSAPDSAWDRKLPSIRELNFPDHSHATWIECCLHNGLIGEALQGKIDRLKDQTWKLQSEWHAARERNSNALLRRWKTESAEKERRQ